MRASVDGLVMTFPHGLMFHHFHGAPHPKGQGAISAEDLSRIICCYEGRILPAQEWLARSIAGTLDNNHVCLTFDDGLKCQIDLALPVLNKIGLTAFWFVYSAPLEGGAEQLEMYRYFRTVAFRGHEDFYDSFYETAFDLFPSARSEAALGSTDSYLSEYKFYSSSDRRFRYLRDRVLGPERYRLVMERLISMTGFDVDSAKQHLWISEQDVRSLHEAGHVIGLHTYSHPMTVGTLPVHEQDDEYLRNADHLRRVTGASPICVSHPCNSYSTDTLAVLNALGVRLGFRANLDDGPARSPLEYPREDHANIMRHLMKEGAIT